MNVFKQVRRLLRYNSLLSRPITRGSLPRSDTAGIIIIGDEVLRGDIPDTNVHHLCSQLRDVGINVGKVSIIPDDVDVIANEVKQFSAAYRYVFTSGGVGPTHDDVTYEGIAKALGEGVHVDSGILEAFKTLYGRSDGGPLAKFATVPESAKILYGDINLPGRTLRLPLVRARNIYILPGVPKALIALFPLFIEDEKRVRHTGLQMEEVFLKDDEVSITPLLNDTAEKFKGRVKIGSYPQLDNNYYRVRLSLEARNRADIEDVKSFLLKSLPSGSIAQFDHKPLENAWEKLEAVVGKEPHVAITVSTIEKAVRTFTLQGFCIGFSGGKDCTVLLHIVYAVLQKKYGNDMPKIQCFFVKGESVWPENIDFIEKSARAYNCDLHVIPSSDYKIAMQQYMEQHSNVKAFLLGNRSTDPAGSKLEQFTPTDPGWPKAIRVFPLLHWSYGDVWTFIRGLSIPYCTLYDMGYSSIGQNEAPNEALVCVNESGTKRFKPAYLLEDPSLERHGRK